MNKSKLKMLLPNRITLAIALFFGLSAFAIIKSNAIIQIGNTGTFTDPREVFTILGSAFTGPIGAIIIGFWAGVGIPGGKWLASILAHMLAGIFIGISYKYVIFPTKQLILIIFKWIGLFIIYYYFLLAPSFVLFSRILYQENISLLQIIGGIHLEVIFTSLITFVIVLILPEKYKQPIW